MTIPMQNADRLTLTEVRRFVEDSGTVRFTTKGREAVHGFIERVLNAQQYRRLGRANKGIVRR